MERADSNHVPPCLPRCPVNDECVQAPVCPLGFATRELPNLDAYDEAIEAAS